MNTKTKTFSLKKYTSNYIFHFFIYPTKQMFTIFLWTNRDCVHIKLLTPVEQNKEILTCNSTKSS